MACLVLWDVDHTLIENAGVSKEIYAAAFHSLASRAPTAAAITEGRTDPEIMLNMFSANGLPMPPWSEVRAALRLAGAAHIARLQRVGYALPGAEQVLRAISSRSDTYQTAVSGNISENALVKLSAFGLDKFLNLDVGGYGSDSSSRDELVRIAKQRSTLAYDAVFTSENTIVVGDTPRDVSAGRLGGARVLAVASGEHSRSELKAAGADMVVMSLTDTERVLNAIDRLARGDA